jgi:hypothetical protein
MKMIHQVLWVAAVVALAGMGAHAQVQQRLQGVINRAPDASANADAESQKISGTVTDAAGQPVRGTTVEYWGYEGNLFQPNGMESEQKTTTRADGTFDFKVPRGNWFLVARKSGLASAWKSWGLPFNAMGGGGDQTGVDASQHAGGHGDGRIQPPGRPCRGVRNHGCHSNSRREQFAGFQSYYRQTSARLFFRTHGCRGPFPD